MWESKRAATSSITADQARRRACTSRIERYHGVYSPLRSQRQSGRGRSNSQTGTPNAPARCATAVSTAITRSSCARIAAVSAKSVIVGSQGFSQWAALATSAARGPTCSEVQDTPSIPPSGAHSARGIGRPAIERMERIPRPNESDAESPILLAQGLARRARSLDATVRSGALPSSDPLSPNRRGNDIIRTNTSKARGSTVPGRAIASIPGTVRKGG